MHYTGQVYRHPMEANTPLLEVTIGCTHNECSFCTMYRETKFHVSRLEHVEEDLQELRSYGVSIKRIYLLNADPFALSINKLIRIGEMIHEYLPEVETITMYASIQNIRNKSVEDLKKLRALGYNDLHIGVESAYDPALKQMNKGFTQAEAREQIAKLQEAGMRWDALLMLGVAGAGNGMVAMKETVDFLNETKPYMLSIMPTSVYPGSPLEEMVNNGEYVGPTEREILAEEKYMLQNVDIDDCYFFGSHVNNIVPMSGDLKTKRNVLIGHLDKMVEEIDDATLDAESKTTAV